MNSSIKTPMDRAEALKLLDDIAIAASRNAALIRRGQVGAQELPREVSDLEQQVARLKACVRLWMRGGGHLERPVLHVVKSDGCDRCRSTRSEPCGRGGRRCIDCGWTYGAD